MLIMGMEEIDIKGIRSMCFDVAMPDVVLLSSEKIHNNWNVLRKMAGIRFRIDWAIILVTSRGCVSLHVDGKSLRCNRLNMAIAFSSRLLQIDDVSDDFEGFVFAYSKRFLLEKIKFKFRPQITLEFDPIIPISELGVGVMSDAYSLIRRMCSIPDLANFDKMLGTLLEINYEMIKSLAGFTSRIDSTSEYHTECFMQLLEEHVRHEHNLDFYADKMKISKKHLMVSVKKATGHTAFEVGDYYLFVDAKNLLLDSHYTIKEVAKITGFPSQSNFGVWFKRKAGMSPSEFRIKTANAVTD